MTRGKMMAEEILSLNERWNNASKETILGNVETALIKQYPTCVNPCDKRKMLMFFTDSGKHTVYAWLNRSRESIKIPFLKLCMIAEKLEMDVSDLLKS